MAVKFGPFRVEFEDVFPSGARAKRVQPAWDFKKSSGEHKVQAHDPDTGEPVWLVTVIDDSDSDEMVRVKVASATEPFDSDPSGGRYQPVIFEGLLVQPYVNQRGYQSYSVRAGAMRLAEESGEKRSSRSKETAA